VKQTLFAILEPEIRGRAFLDLYAGSGAGGIEALSRGASRAVFVESDKTAAQVIQRNLEATGLDDERADVARESVDAWLALSSRRDRIAAGPFAVVLIDPPYDSPVMLDWALEGIADAGRDIVLAQDGLVVAKHFWKEPPLPNRLLRSVREERFGETMLTFYRWAEQEDG
jgi:16S rRNA (guanine(966)-N(2))-methyltransferase RsmD